ncbi:hypothetical protein ACJ2_07170 [Pantoea sp. QMID2]|nr:hypothetical protein ACJ3_07180 [Pantoea sp. QMID3]GME51284.1 hypothetical protein ACJ4_07180 [Pantoea sp. QMID4]GME52503.1 hypothetical protein ACJ2_07170 [Pantoea sp. QMID2]
MIARRNLVISDEMWFFVVRNASRLRTDWLTDKYHFVVKYDGHIKGGDGLLETSLKPQFRK